MLPTVLAIQSREYTWQPCQQIVFSNERNNCNESHWNKSISPFFFVCGNFSYSICRAHLSGQHRNRIECYASAILQYSMLHFVHGHSRHATEPTEVQQNLSTIWHRRRCARSMDGLSSWFRWPWIYLIWTKTVYDGIQIQTNIRHRHSLTVIRSICGFGKCAEYVSIFASSRHR